MTQFDQQFYNRRQFLTLTGSALGAASMSPLLSGCAAAAVGVGPFVKTVAFTFARAFATAVAIETATNVPEGLGKLIEAVQNQFEAPPTEILVVRSGLLSKPENPILETVAAASGPTQEEVTVSVGVQNGAQEILFLPAHVALGLGVLHGQLQTHFVESGYLAEDARVIATQALTVSDVVRTSGSNDLLKSSTYRVLMEDRKYVEIEWQPTTSLTKKSRIKASRGDVLNGREPTWIEGQVIETGFASLDLWGDDPPIDTRPR
jgi:hypothetical protein